MDQPTHQALVELLFLALYQDGHLSVEEDSVLEKALKQLGWEPEERSGPSVGVAFAAVREANSSDEKREAFLVDRATKVKDEGDAPLAMELLGRVLGSDGMTPEEGRFFARIETLLA